MCFFHGSANALSGCKLCKTHLRELQLGESRPTVCGDYVSRNQSGAKKCVHYGATYHLNRAFRAGIRLDKSNNIVVSVIKLIVNNFSCVPHVPYGPLEGISSIYYDEQRQLVFEPGWGEWIWLKKNSLRTQNETESVLCSPPWDTGNKQGELHCWAFL